MAKSFLQAFNDYLMYGKKPTDQAPPSAEAVVPPPDALQAPVSGPVMQDRMVMSTDQPSAFKATPYLPQKPLIVDTPPDRTVTSDDLMSGYGKSKPIIPDLGPRLNQALQDQERSVDDSERLLNSYLTSDQRADISPMLALLDTTKDKRLINAYKRPLTADEYAGNVAKFQNYLADNRKGVSDSYKSLTAQKSQDRYLDHMLRQQGREQGYLKDIVKDASKDVGKLQEDYINKSRQLDRIEQIFQKGNVAEIKGALSNFARTVQDEKGPLNEGDVNRAFFQDLAGKFDAWQANLDPSAKFDPKQLQASLNLIKYAKDSMNDVYSSSLAGKRQTYDSRAKVMGLGQHTSEGTPFYQMFDNAAKSARTSSLPGSKAPAPQQQVPSAEAPKVPEGWVLNPATGKYRRAK